MIDKRIAIIMMAETSPRRSTAPKPEPRPPTPLTDRNKIQLESLSRWLHGFEDDDSALKKHHSAINYPKLKSKGLRYGGVELVNQDPDPEQIQRQHREVHNMEDAHTPVENSFMDDEEVQLRRAVKRTRFLLSRLGTALRAVNTADSEIPMNHEPMYDWHLRPATSHVHGEPKPELPAYSVGVLHNNEPTAMPILKYGWTWREIPIESETDRWQKIPTTSTKQNVNSLIDRGYVPQGADLSRLMAPTETNQLPIIKHAKMELNKPSTRVMDPIKRYSTFDRPVIPHLMKPQKKLPPLPDICTNTKLQKEIAKTLGIETVTKSMRYLEKLAYTESPQSVIIFKPPCPLYREEKPQRALAQLRFSQTHPKLLAPPATRQNSAGYNTIDSVRTDPSNNWTIFIMDGFAVTTSDAYLNFKTRYHDIWPQIRYFIWKTENLLQRYAVPCAEVKCQELILLASVIPAPAGQISLDSLQKLLFNSEEVLSIIRKPGQIYKGTGLDCSRNLAARRIQNKWSAYKSRILLKDYHEMMKSSRIMIKSFRLKKFRSQLYQQILGRFETQQKKRFYRWMNALVKEWREANMAARPKVILQLAPRFFNFDVMDYVIGRTIMLYDGSVEQLVLVIPHLTDEKRKYIREQLATGFLDLDPIAAGRLKLISPETAKCFVPGSSVAAMLQSSHKALAQVKSILDGRLSFLMTDTIGRAEIGLSSLLDIPVIGSKPEKAKRINTRHKARVFLRNAGFEVVPGMSFKPGPQYKLKEVLLHLTAKYQTNVAFWEIFEKRRSSQMDFAKPDCAFDASIDFESVPHLTAFDEETVDEAASKFNLQENLTLRKCPTYIDFIHRVCGIIGPKLPITQTKGTGGFIQACPVHDGTLLRRIEVGFLIDMGGTYSQLLSAEVLLAKDFEQIGFVVPQQRLPHAMLMKIVDRLLTNCTKAGIFGYVTLQISAWWDPVTERNGWWTNNLYPFLSPTLLKASSVLVSSGCEIDAKTGISSFQWTDIPLHLERTQNAVFTDHPLLRADFEHNIIKQAGGETEQRVAIYAENLRSEEIVRLTWRGFVQTCQRDGVRFNEKTRKGTYFPLVNPDIPMLMPMVTMGSDYKSTIAAFLKDLTICHRRLKHYDCIDLVSNVKDTARFFIQEWKNVDTNPQYCISATHYPEFVADAYASIFNLKRAPSEVPGDDSGNANKTPLSRRKNFSKISSDAAEPLQLQLLKRQHSSMAAGAGIKSVKEDLISSDSDDSFSEEKVEQRGSIPYLAGLDTVQSFIKITKPEGNRGDEIPVIRPLTAEEKNEFFDLHKLRTIRLADKPQPPAWWDTLHFHPVDPTGKIHHIDAYDPKNPSQKHFELNPDVHPLAHEDLDTLVASSIPPLVKLAASSRPVTSCARKIKEVLDEIERSKRPPPPAPEQRSSLSISLLNEGIPSVIAGKYDPTFKKPTLAKPFKQSERYKKMRRGEFSSEDMDVINAALGKYERIYEEKFPTVPVVEVIDRRPKKAVAVNGSIHYLTEDEMQDVGQSETDLAVAAAFALMKEVNSRHIDAPATPKKSGTPKKGGSLRDINKVGGSLKDLSRGLDSANGNRVADSAKVKNVSGLKNVITPADVESGEDEDEYKEPPLLDVKLRPRKLSTKIAEQATKLTEQERRKSLIVMEGQPHVLPELRNHSMIIPQTTDTPDKSRQASMIEFNRRQSIQSEGTRRNSGIGIVPPVVAERPISPANEELKRQMIEEKTASVMSHLTGIVNRDDKGDRLKNILGDLLSLTRTGELSEAELGAEHVGLVKGGGSGSNPHLLSSTSSRLSPDRGHTSDSLRPNSRVSGRSRMSLNQSDAME